MPQELHVVRCFSCETFQVDIVKKLPKWTCKMCGEKQSLKKVYGQGTGKDCRLIVQNFNQQRISLQNGVLENATDTKNEQFTNGNDIKPYVGEMQQGANKWSEFLAKDVKDETVEEGPSNTFECQRNKRQILNNHVYQDVTEIGVNDKKLLHISQQSEYNVDETENVSQNHFSKIPITNTDSKWKEFCFRESEDKITKQLFTTKNLRSVTNIFADEDIDFDSALDF